MNKEELEFMLEEREDQFIESRESLRMKEEIGGAVCAFASASGTIMTGRETCYVLTRHKPDIQVR